MLGVLTIQLHSDCHFWGRELQSGKLIAGYWIAGDAAYECKYGVVTPRSKCQLMDGEGGPSRDAFTFFRLVCAYTSSKHLEC